MKCSICEKEAVGFFVTRTYLVFNSPKIFEARCKDHLNYRNYKWRKKKSKKNLRKIISLYSPSNNATNVGIIFN